MIGPVLFLVYINDLPENIRSKLQLFADDTILCMTIASEENCILLQENLDAMQKWEAVWKLKFNGTKCEVLRMSRSKSSI